MRHSNRSRNSRIALAMGIASLLATYTTASAGNGTWTSASGGSWSNLANWSAGNIADGSGFTADFSTVDLTADATVHLDASHILNSLIFGNTDASPAANWFLDNNGDPTNILTLAGTAPTITVNSLGAGKAATISAVIDGTQGLTKTGSGTLVLTAGNTYTGTTSINAGTLTLDFTSPTAPTTNILNSTGTLSLGGGALQVKGASASNNQTFAGTTLATGTGSKIVATGTIGGNLVLGAITRNAGSTIDFTLPTSGSITTSTTPVGGRLALTDSTGAAYATVNGTDWATVSSGRIVALTGTNYTSVVVGSSGTAGNLGGNFINANLTGGNSATYTLNTNINPDTVRVMDGGHTINLSTFVLSTGGILTNQNITISGTTGKLEPDTNGGELVFNQTTGSSTISANIANIAAATAFTKTGAGTLTLSAVNGYTGTTTIQAGMLIVNGGGSGTLTNSANVYVRSGATLQTQSGSATNNLTFGSGPSNTLQIDAGGLVYNPNATQNSIKNLVMNGGTLKADNANAGVLPGGNWSFRGTVSTLGSVQNPTTSSITGGNADVSSTGTTFQINGADTLNVSSAIGQITTGALVKTGNGTLNLSGANSYSGTTTVSAGTLLVIGTGTISSSATTVNGGTIGGTGTLGATTVNSGGTFAPGVNGIGSITVAGSLTLAGTAAFDLNKNSSSFALTADLATLTSGTLTLGGTLSLSETGAALAAGDSFQLFNAPTYAGTFSSMNLPTLNPGLSWDTSNIGVTGTVAVVPEPGAVMALMGGTAMLLGLRRRRAWS
jgi:fibronectin-binding autotransporter adhesin